MAKRALHFCDLVSDEGEGGSPGQSEKSIVTPPTAKVRQAKHYNNSGRSGPLNSSTPRIFPPSHCAPRHNQNDGYRENASRFWQKVPASRYSRKEEEQEEEKATPGGQNMVSSCLHCRERGSDNLAHAVKHMCQAKNCAKVAQQSGIQAATSLSLLAVLLLVFHKAMNAGEVTYAKVLKLLV